MSGSIYLQENLHTGLSGFELLPLTMKIRTNDSGNGTFAIQVPGTFGDQAVDLEAENDPEIGLNGYTVPIAQGRYFFRLEIWPENPVHGDLFKLELRDTDGVLSSEQQALFPKYPILIRFYDDDVTEVSGDDFDLIRGLKIKSGEKLVIEDISNIPDFMPAQMYLCGEFQQGPAVEPASGLIYVNLLWGKRITKI